MELRHLRYFVATARAQSFTKAAQALHIAQPPLGQQVRALEEEVGTPLFHRQGRAIVLSDAGRVFMRCAEDILERVEDAKKAAQRAARGEIGTLSLGFTESASFNTAVTTLISRYQDHYPNVDINLVEGNSEALIARLGRRELDAAIVRPPFTSAGSLGFELLSEEPLLAVLPANHPLAACDALSLEALRHERFVLYSRKSGHGLSADIIAECRALGFNPQIHQQAPQVSSAVNLVSAGMGIAVVPASMRSLQRPGLVFRPLAHARTTAILGLATRAGERSAVIEQLVACARGCARARQSG